MRENNIVWGVGRGFSVSKLCVILIGIHKLIPSQYDPGLQRVLR